MAKKPTRSPMWMDLVKVHCEHCKTLTYASHGRLIKIKSTCKYMVCPKCKNQIDLALARKKARQREETTGERTMGYYISTHGEIKIEPEIQEGHKRLIENQAKAHAKWGGNWIVENNSLVWDDDISKSYPDAKSLDKLIKTYFQPWGYILNGTVEYKGDNQDDKGSITVRSNKVSEKKENPYG